MRESAFSICREGVLRDVFPRVGKVDGTCRVGLSHVWENGEGRAASAVSVPYRKKGLASMVCLRAFIFAWRLSLIVSPPPCPLSWRGFGGRDPGVKVSAPWHCRAAWHSLNQHLFAVSDIQPLLGHGVQPAALQVIYGGLSIICSTAGCRLRPDLRPPPRSASCDCY